MNDGSLDSDSLRALQQVRGVAWMMDHWTQLTESSPASEGCGMNDGSLDSDSLRALQ